MSKKQFIIGVVVVSLLVMGMILFSQKNNIDENNTGLNTGIYKGNDGNPLK